MVVQGALGALPAEATDVFREKEDEDGHGQFRNSGNRRVLKRDRGQESDDCSVQSFDSDNDASEDSSTAAGEAGGSSGRKLHKTASGSGLSRSMSKDRASAGSAQKRAAGGKPSRELSALTKPGLRECFCFCRHVFFLKRSYRMYA
jgi:hypothetical protein